MIQPYPFFRVPGFRRPYPYYTYPKHSYKPTKKTSQNQENSCIPKISPKNKQENFDYSSNTIENKNCNFNNIDIIENNAEECFEIFGLKLHFDDLLIIALLFFLYQEDVKDTYLYIVLILLLLS